MITCKESKNLQGHHEALKYIGKHVNHWWDGNGKGILTFAPSNPGVPQLGQVWLPIGDENVCIYDKEGNALPTQVLPREEIELNGLGQLRNPCWPPEIMRNVLFLANSGANRVDSFVCKTSPGKKFNDISADDNYMENEYLRVEVNGAGYILRFYENQGRNAEALIRLNGFSKAFLSNMNEDILEEIKIKDGIISINVGAYKVITLVLER